MDHKAVVHAAANRYTEMAAGVFIVSKYPQDSQHPNDIAFTFTQASAGKEVPADQQKLKADVERMLIVLTSIYPAQHEKFSYYYERILSLSQAGLVGTKPSTKGALKTLLILKEEFAIKEGAYVKEKYNSRLIKTALFCSLPILLIWVFSLLMPKLLSTIILEFLHLFRGSSLEDDSNSLRGFFYLLNLSAVLAGSLLGGWLSAAHRVRQIDFKHFELIEEGQIGPGIRYGLILGYTLILSILLYLGFVRLSIAGIELSKFYEHTIISFAFGCFCGLGDRALPSRLNKEANRFLGSRDSEHG